MHVDDHAWQRTSTDLQKDVIVSAEDVIVPAYLVNARVTKAWCIRVMTLK